MPTNRHGHPIGATLDETRPKPRPSSPCLNGRCIVLRRTSVADAAALFEAFQEDPSGALWTYISVEQPASAHAFEALIVQACLQDYPFFYTIWDHSGRALGFASFLRISPNDASIEIGWITLSPRMRRTVASTEALFLMMRYALSDLGYRRLEWKCDALNGPSRAAALRLGFTFEGIFRQATHYKGRNRDTAWFSILDHEWPALQRRFETYLDPGNFTTDGTQIIRLQDC